MDTETVERPSPFTARHTDIAALRALALGLLTGGNPNPEDPGKPGPWDPVIRKLLARLRDRFGPHPDPWRHADALALGVGRSLELPIMAAEEIVEQVSMLHAVDLATGQRERLVSSFLQGVYDEVELCPRRPRPPKGFGLDDRMFTPADIVTIGVALEQLAATIPAPQLRAQVEASGRAFVAKGARLL